MSTVNGFQVGSETLKYNYESLDNYNTPNFSTSSSTTYAVGDYVMYNGKLYKCTTATTGGTWVSGSWTEAVLSDDVCDLNRHLSDVEDAIGYRSVELVGEYTNNYWNDQTATAVLTPISSGYFACDPIEVVPGTSYSIVAYQGTSNKQHTLLFVDDTYGILEKHGEHTSGYLTGTFVAPVNAKYALITIGSRNMTIMGTTSFAKIEFVSKSNILAGKRVAIIGDSISTNGNPSPNSVDPNAVEITVQTEDIGVELSAYLTWYDVEANLTLGGHTFTSSEIGTEVHFTPTAEDVGKVIGLPLTYNQNPLKTWWEVVKNQLNFIPIPVCWSGASITSHENTSERLKTSWSWHDSQIRKCGIRIPGTMERIAPDVIIVYRGTNDFSHSPVVTLTDNYFESLSWEYPSTDVVNGDYGYKEGYALLIKKLREAYPNTVIYCCTLNVFKRNIADQFPTRNSLYTLPEFNKAIREIADFFGCNLIDFEKDGITFENCYTGGYIVDSATTPTHPSAKGHAVMGQRALNDIINTYIDIS